MAGSGHFAMSIYDSDVLADRQPWTATDVLHGWVAIIQSNCFPLIGNSPFPDITPTSDLCRDIFRTFLYERKFIQMTEPLWRDHLEALLLMMSTTCFSDPVGDISRSKLDSNSVLTNEMSQAVNSRSIF